MDRLLSVLRPLSPFARPEFHGLARIPEERPLLFVGNHTVYGILDVPFLFERLYRDRGILLRGLGDHLHFQVPGWRDFLLKFGVVHGTRDNCAALMEAGECVLVFPGGAREVSRRKGERHSLIWKQRIGFAKMAIRHRCTIVPFSAVGIDDSFDLLADADEILGSAVGPVLRRLRVREDAIPPIPRSFHFEKLYFRIADPIPTAHLEGRDDDERCWELRREVEASILGGIRELRARQAEDAERRTFAVLRNEARAGLEAMWSALRPGSRSAR